MGRKAIYSKEEFIRAYKRAKSARQLAAALQMSVPTVFNYINRYKLKLYKSPLNPLSFKIAKAFTHNNTVKDLAKRFKLSQSAIRYHLDKFVLCPDKYQLSPDWSPPEKVSHIRVINAFIANPKATDNPKIILRLPGMTQKLVENYWLYATGLTLE